MKGITPEQLHNWYLEAVRDLDEEHYNKNAEKPFDELTAEQKFIDEAIADRINEYIRFNSTIKIEFEADDIEGNE